MGTGVEGLYLGCPIWLTITTLYVLRLQSFPKSSHKYFCFVCVEAFVQVNNFSVMLGHIPVFLG